MRLAARGPIWAAVRSWPSALLCIALGAGLALASWSPLAGQTPLPTAGGAWTNAGPQPILTTSGALGGPVDALAASGSTLWVAAPGGGLWTWDGAVWTPRADAQPTLVFSALAAAPKALYAGAGDWTLTDGGVSEQGLWESNDGGATWTRLAASTFAGNLVTAIAVSSTNPSDLTVAAAPVATGATGGVYASSDGGATWSVLATGAAWSVVSDATGYLLAAEGPGLERWNPGASSPTLVTPAGAAAAKFILAAAASSDAVAALALNANGQCAGVYLTQTDGNGWTPLPCPTSASLPLPVAFSFAPDGSLWLGANALWSLATGSGASPPATSWTMQTEPVAPGLFHALLFAGGNAWLGGDGGVWERAGASGAWQNVNGLGNGLGAARLISAVSGANALVASSAFAGIMTSAGTGGASSGATAAWSAGTPSGVGASLAAAPDGETLYAALPAAGGLWVSANGGQSWNATPWGAGAPNFSNGSPPPRRAVLAVSPGAATSLFLATDRLWSSLDSGLTWTPLQAALPAGVLTSVAVAPQSGAVLYEGDSLGQVFRSSDGGGAWSAAGSGLPARAVTALAVDADPAPANAAAAENTLVAGVGGFDAATPAAPGHLFLSTDGGATWTNISAALPDEPAVAIALDPLAPSAIYAALATGVYASPDLGATWYRFGSALPAAPMRDLRLAGRELLAATAGRGLWVLPLPAAGQTIVAVSGGGQSAAAGAALAQPLIARVTNTLGLPVAGASVAWSDGGAGGTFSAATSLTDASGQASASYTAGSKAQSVLISASVAGGGAASFAVTVTSGVAAKVLANSGGGQSGVTSQSLANPLVAEVTDAAGNPVAGVTVTWSDAGAGGGFSSASVVTNAQGLASVVYTLPAGAGAITISASAPGLPPVLFSATALAAPDFALALSPATATANQEANATFQVSATALGADARVISLTCAVPATGCSVSPGAISPGGAATVTVAFQSLGANTVTIEGNDGAHTHQASATVNVPTPDFGLSATAPGGGVNQVDALALAIGTAAINGDYHLISFACPASLTTCSFSPAQVTPGQSTTLSLPANALSPGTQTITVTASDGNNQHTVAIVLNVLPPGLSVSLATPSATVSAGQSAVAALTVTPTGGLNGLVSLSCLGLPSGVACAFQPATVTSNGTTPATVSLTVDTTGNALAAPPPGSGGPEAPRNDARLWQALVLALALCLLAAAAPRRSRRAAGSPRRWRAAPWLLALSLSLAACGGGAAAPPPPPPPVYTGTPPGSYSIKIVAASGAVTIQTTLSLTVQ